MPLYSTCRYNIRRRPSKSSKYRSFLKHGGIIIVGVYQANKDWLFGKLLQEACNQGRYAIVDIAYAASVSDDLAWRMFVSNEHAM